MIEKVAELLGVKLYEEFRIRPTEMGRSLGYKIIDKNKTFRFDTELVYKGHHNGWSEWYGSKDCGETLYRLLLGLYEIVKIEE